MQPSSAQRGAPSMIVMVLVGQRSAHWPQLMVQVGSAKNSEVDRGFSSLFGERTARCLGIAGARRARARGLRCDLPSLARGKFRASKQALALLIWAGAYRYVQLPTDFTLNEASRLMPCASNRRLPKTRAVLPTNAPQLITAKQ